MKRSRFTEEQVIAALNEHTAGAVDEGSLPAAGDRHRDAVQLEAQVRRDGGERGEAVAGS